MHGCPQCRCAYKEAVQHLCGPFTVNADGPIGLVCFVCREEIRLGQPYRRCARSRATCAAHWHERCGRRGMSCPACWMGLQEALRERQLD